MRVTVSTFPKDYTRDAIACAATADAPRRIERRVERHASMTIAACDAVIDARRAAGTLDMVGIDQLHSDCMDAARTYIGLGTLMWMLVLRSVISWIVWWYLDLIFTESSFAPWSEKRWGE